MNSIVENTKNKKQFVFPTFDAVDCFLPQKVFCNSWFYIGRVNAEGHDLVFLFHLMGGTVKFGGLANTVVSILDRKENFYESKDSVDTAFQPFKVENDMLKFSTKFASLDGNMKTNMRLKADLPNSSLDVVVHPVGNVIYNGGSGCFALPSNPNNWQYSCPQMTMDGSITINGRTYTFTDGSCWFDRQWNNPKLNAKTAKTYNPKWMWMGIKLDNGEDISLWEILPQDGTHYTFATILRKDGTQAVAYMEPCCDTATDKWKSEKTGQNYPTKWNVVIPDYEIELEVICVPAHQEIVSDVAVLNKYEAESIVTGTYKGKAVSGNCCVELLGTWN